MTGIVSCYSIKRIFLHNFTIESQFRLPKHRGHKAVDKEVYRRVHYHKYLGNLCSQQDPHWQLTPMNHVFFVFVDIKHL